MALLIGAGRTDLQAKVDYMHDVIKKREAQDQTVKVAISSATDAKRKLVEGVCGVRFVHSLSSILEQSKRQRIQQQPSASINQCAWTGTEDTTEEIERLKLRLQALIGWMTSPLIWNFGMYTRRCCSMCVSKMSPTESRLQVSFNSAHA